MPIWNDVDRARAAEMLRAGLTASMIGHAFGLTRNAIIGRVQRSPELSKIGFDRNRGQKTRTPQKQSRYAGVLAAPKPPTTRSISAPPPRQPAPAIISRPSIVVEKINMVCRGVPLVDLNDHVCRYPINDPKPFEGFIFCGTLPRKAARIAPATTESAWAEEPFQSARPVLIS